MGPDDHDDDAGRDDDELEGPEEFEPDEDDGFQTIVSIEINGLSLYTHHGVSAAEREIGQRLLIDLKLEVGEVDATVTDLVEDTVDYGQVCNVVALVAQQRNYKTLERLATAIADRLLGDFPLEAVEVKCTKPEPPIALAVEDVGVTVWREPEE
jgi:dihydroneopterin aldolase